MSHDLALTALTAYPRGHGGPCSCLTRVGGIGISGSATWPMRLPTSYATCCGSATVAWTEAATAPSRRRELLVDPLQAFAQGLLDEPVDQRLTRHDVSGSWVFWAYGLSNIRRSHYLSSFFSDTGSLCGRAPVIFEIFSLKHYWRFVDLEALELQALS